MMAFEQNNSVFLEPDRDGVQRTTIIPDSDTCMPDRLRIQAGDPVEIRLASRSFLTPHHCIIDSFVPNIRRNVNIDAGENVAVQCLPETPGASVLYCDMLLQFFPSHCEEDGGPS